MQVVDMGEFTCFCRDFKVELPRIKLAEIFKRVGYNKSELDYEKFQEIIRQVGEELAKAKLKEN